MLFRSCREYPDQELIVLGSRFLHLLQLKNVWWSVSCEHGCFHSCTRPLHRFVPRGIGALIPGWPIRLPTPDRRLAHGGSHPCGGNACAGHEGADSGCGLEGFGVLGKLTEASCIGIRATKISEDERVAMHSPLVMRGLFAASSRLPSSTNTKATSLATGTPPTLDATGPQIRNVYIELLVDIGCGTSHGGTDDDPESERREDGTED